MVRRYLSFFPSNNQEPPPVIECDDPVDRRVEELYDIVPTAPRRAYDMKKVVAAVVDDGDFLEIKPQWARNIVTALARVGGRPVGVLANQPMVLGGALDVNAADKAARFVWLCDAFGIPLVFLHDVPGFIVGSAVEKQGIIRHGAKMLFAVSEATVPEGVDRAAQELRRRLLRHERPRVRGRLLAIWPTAEIAVMGPEGMVNITMRKQLEADPRRQGARRGPHRAWPTSSARTSTRTSPPGTRRSTTSSTRPTPASRSGAASQVSATKPVQRPWRKHGVLPV